MAASSRSRTIDLPVPLGVLGDERLAKLVGQGNERAFAALYGRYHQALYRYCYTIVRHESDAQDALQSAFTSALGALRRGQRDAPLKPWLFRIAHNESISLLRRRRPQNELPETLESRAPSVEDTVEERARMNVLMADLQALPERQRSALVMRELSGLSHEELAEALSVSVGAAKQTVFEARQALQEFEAGRAMPCEDIQRLVSDGDRRALRGRRVRAHLRGCKSCAAFSEAIPARRETLRAFTPALPAAAASGLLARVTGAGTAHHGGGGLLAGLTGKSVGVAVSAKSVAAGIAIVATVGAVGAVEAVNHFANPTPSVRLTKDGVHGLAGRAGSSSHGAGLGAGAAAGAHARSRGSAGPLGSHSASRSATHAAGRGDSHRSGGLGALTTAGVGHGGTASAAGSATGSSGPATGGSSNATGGNPNAGGGNANAHGGNPNAGGGNAGGSSNAGGTNSNAHGGNPNAKGGNPNAAGGNPNAGSGSSNAHGANPNAAGGNAGGSSSTGTGSTNAHGGNPNAGGGNAGGSSSTGTGSTNAHGGNPNAGAGNAGGSSSTGTGSTNAHGGNPNAKGGKSGSGGY